MVAAIVVDKRPAIAETEGFEITEEDTEKHFADLARRFGGDPAEIRSNFERAGVWVRQ